MKECVTKEQKTQKEPNRNVRMKTSMYVKIANLLDELIIKISQIKESMTIKKKSIQFEKQ